MSTLLEQASLVMIPSGYKEDIVYSEVPTNGNGDLSFTRSSNGTRINSAGLVEVTPWNLVEQSEDFSNAAWNKYQSAITANATTAPNGTTTADKLEYTTTGTAVLFATSSALQNQVYALSCYAKQGTTNILQIGFTLSGGDKIANFNLNTGVITTTSSGVTASIESVGDGWYRCIMSLTTDINTPNVFINSTSGTTGNYIYIWGAQLNIGSTAKPYFPTTDRLNVPRLTYQNGGGGCPSLLLEKQSTNIVKYSQDISNTSGSYWGDGSSGGTATLTANYATSPDGTSNATRVQLNEGSLYAVWQQVLTTTAGTTYTYSIWLKAVSGTPTILFLYDGTANQNVTLTNEWVRYTFTFTGGTIAIARFGLWSSVWGTSTTADILAYGAQLEVSSYPTSYIPTTSASATRVADACFKTGISSLIGQSQGTIFVDFVWEGLGTASVDNAIFSIGEQSYGTSNIAISNYNSSLYGRVTNVTTVEAGVSFGAMTIGTRYKCAIGYASNDFVFYVNGVNYGNDTSVSIPALSDAYFQNAYPNSKKVNQAILFKTRLTNAELASLTTL